MLSALPLGSIDIFLTHYYILKIIVYKLKALTLHQNNDTTHIL